MNMTQNRSAGGVELLKRTRILFVALLALWVFACDEESTSNVEPPPPPPQLTVEAYNPAAQGLSADVWDVFVDSRKRVWLATNTGLWVKDAGSGSIWTYDDFNGIANRQTRSILEVGDKMFVATWGGGFATADTAAINDSTMWTTIDEDDGLTNNKVADITSEGSINVWFATADGLSQYINDSRPLKNRWVSRNGLLGPDRVVRSVHRAAPVSSSRQVWICRQGAGIRILNFGSNPSLTPANSAMPEWDVNEAVYDQFQDLWWVAFPTSGLASVDMTTSTWTIYTTRQGLISDLCHSVAVQSDGTVWVGTQVGLSRFKNGEFTNYIRGSGLPYERIRHVFVDSDDNVWLAFVEGGAARVAPK